MTIAEEFPKWNESSTVGDVVAVSIATRLCMVEIMGILLAMQQGDSERAQALLASLLETDEDLARMIDRIGGVDG